MPRSKSNSSAATARAPYAPATRLEHVPFVFYEILEFATRGKAREIVPLIESVIEVTQVDPEGLLKLARVAQEEILSFPGGPVEKSPIDSPNGGAFLQPEATADSNAAGQPV